MMPFANYHLIISRHDFERQKRRLTYIPANHDHSLCTKEIMPSYENFMNLLHKYGSPWEWHLRPKYNNRQDILNKLNQKESRLFLFTRDEEEIGYCLISAPIKLRGGSQRNTHIIEIENIALAPQFTGKGYGRYLLGQIFEELFKTYRLVYLTSRDTNHEKVIPFYIKMGMSLLKVDKNIPDDLIDAHDKAA